MKSENLDTPQTAKTIRVVDQETARVVTIHRSDGRIVGAGCLLDGQNILTCFHVVNAALDRARVGDVVFTSLVGVTHQPTFAATVVKLGDLSTENDLALLQLNGAELSIPEVEFASPMRHGGKRYSVLGFPGGDPQGRNVRGELFASDAKGLVQMDRGGALSVLGGFSGAPVWSSDLSAFVGLVVTELSGLGVSWCIPSRRLCEFYPKLAVRFRIPPTDRPIVHDFTMDDPNLQLFGSVSNDGNRELSATITERKTNYKVQVKYECLADTPAPRGRYVTFITYPNFGRKNEDAYELFDVVRDGKAEQEFYPSELFTVAAIGDAGDTALTLDLEKVASQ